MKELKDSKGFKDFVHDIEAQTRGCIASLRKKGLPVSNWYELNSWIAKPLTTREVCGQNPIKYVHEMKHPNIPDTYIVGSVCAAIMSDAREKIFCSLRDLKNKDRREKAFIKKFCDNFKIEAKKGVTKYGYEFRYWKIENYMFFFNKTSQRTFTVTITAKNKEIYERAQTVDNSEPIRFTKDLALATFNLLEKYKE